MSLPLQPLPIYSSTPLSFFHAVELILTHGAEEILIGLGLTGHQRINEKTTRYIRSFPHYEQYVVVEGPFKDEDNVTFFNLWYKHEYDQRMLLVEKRRIIHEVARIERTAKQEHSKKAFAKMLELNPVAKCNTEIAELLFSTMIDRAENENDATARKLLTAYGYYTQQAV